MCVEADLEKTSRCIAINAALLRVAVPFFFYIRKRYKKLSISYFSLRIIDKYTSRRGLINEGRSIRISRRRRKAV